MEHVGSREGLVRTATGCEGNAQTISQNALSKLDFKFSNPIRWDCAAAECRNGPEADRTGAFTTRQLFGWTWGDWEGDGTLDEATINAADQLVIRTTKQAWNASVPYEQAPSRLIILRISNNPSKGATSQPLGSGSCAYPPRAATC